MVKLLEIALPEYKPGIVPPSEAIGRKLDELLRDQFQDQTVVVRCLGLRDHPDHTLEELTDTILTAGTDKYDPKRQGIADHMLPPAYRNKNWFYGEELKIDDTSHHTGPIIDDFYHGAIGDRGYPIRIDLILVYDRAQLDRLENIYKGHIASDIFVFCNTPKSVLLGLVRIW
jgi:hypothetical protein